jgi:hypothetical protein
MVCSSNLTEYSEQYLYRGWLLKRSHKTIHTFNHALSTEPRLNIHGTPGAMLSLVCSKSYILDLVCSDRTSYAMLCYTSTVQMLGMY